MDSVDDCLQCAGGYYCESPGAINFDFSLNDTGTGICSAGYYCKSGRCILCMLQTSRDFYKFFIPLAIVQWNALSESAVCSTDTDSFKVAVSELQHSRP